MEEGEDMDDGPLACGALELALQELMPRGDVGVTGREFLVAQVVLGWPKAGQVSGMTLTG